MQRLFSILLAFALLTGSLASWRAGRCVGQRCGSEKRLECAVKKGCAAQNACSGPASSEGQRRHANAPVPCCFLCSPGCCCYLLPTITGFRLRSFPEEMLEKPHGLQHRYAQSFHRSVWHPPAPEV